MGVEAFDGYSELVLLSGPLAFNHQKSVAKVLATKPMKYDNTYIALAPGTIIEKTFYIDINSIQKEGTAFKKPVQNSILIFKPFYVDDLPGYEEILQLKYLFAKSRWIVGDGYTGFNKYPNDVATKIIIGWVDQCEAPGFALQVLKNHYNDPGLMKNRGIRLIFTVAALSISLVFVSHVLTIRQISPQIHQILCRKRKKSRVGPCFGTERT